MKVFDKLAMLRNAVGTYYYCKNCFNLDIDFEEFMLNFNSYLKANALDITAFTIRLVNEERAKQNHKKKRKE